MATAAVTYEPNNGDADDITLINQNFADLVNFLNNNVVQADGAVAMTGALTLPGAPSTSDQAATKGYVDGIVASAWTSYTPTLTADSGTPAISDGSMRGRYISNGNKTVEWEVALTLGASTSFGTGTLHIGMPVTPRTPATPALANIGSGYVIDASSNQSWIVSVAWDGTKTYLYWDAAGSGANPTVSGSAGTPFAWGSGDGIIISGRYEAA